MVPYLRNLLTDELFDVFEQPQLIKVTKADGQSAAARPARAADTVDIGLRHVGQVEVDDQGQLADVDAPGGDVRGHQNPDLAAFEALQGPDPAALALIAVDSHGGDICPPQLLYHSVCPVLCGGEHQHRLLLALLQKPYQKTALVDLVHPVEPLLNGIHRGGLGRHLHPHRVVEDGPGQLGDLPGHGGGKEQRLPFFRQTGDDLSHVVDKTHIQHPVRLVQHEDLQTSQIHMTLGAQVIEPARGGHQHVHPPLQGLHLRPLAHAAEDDGAAHRQVLAVLLKTLLNLQRQFPGRRQYQRPNGPVAPLPFPLEHLQNGHGEGRGLASTGLGTANQVPARKHRRNGLGLDGRGLPIAQLVHRPQQSRQQLQILKSHQLSSTFLCHSKS